MKKLLIIAILLGFVATLPSYALRVIEKTDDTNRIVKSKMSESPKNIIAENAGASQLKENRAGRKVQDGNWLLDNANDSIVKAKTQQNGQVQDSPSVYDKQMVSPSNASQAKENRAGRKVQDSNWLLDNANDKILSEKQREMNQ